MASTQLNAAKPPPATNPNAGSSASAPSAPSTPSGSKVTFERVEGLRLRVSAPAAAAAASAVASAEPTSPSAPPLEHVGPSRASLHPAAAAALLSAAARGPVDFYASLRASLLPSKMSSTTAEKPSAASVTADEPEHTTSDDEWDLPAASSAPAAGSSAAAAATSAASATDKKAAEDEAIVHNKHASIIVRKMPLKPDLGDGAAAAAATTAAPATKKSSLDEDLFDDDFADIPTAASLTAAASSSGPSSGDGGEDGEEVAVFDLSNADWWFVVPHPDRPGEELKAAPPPPVDPQEDDDGYVVVRNKDSFAALSDFLAQMMLQHPEINKLSPEQLRTMIEGSMAHLKEPSTVGKMWQYGKSAYTVWGWSSTAWSLYKDQTMLRIACAGIIKAATWTCVFLL